MISSKLYIQFDDIFIRRLLHLRGRSISLPLQLLKRLVAHSPSYEPIPSMTICFSFLKSEVGVTQQKELHVEPTYSMLTKPCVSGLSGASVLSFYDQGSNLFYIGLSLSYILGLVTDDNGFKDKPAALILTNQQDSNEAISITIANSSFPSNWLLFLPQQYCIKPEDKHLLLAHGSQTISKLNTILENDWNVIKELSTIPIITSDPVPTVTDDDKSHYHFQSAFCDNQLTITHGCHISPIYLKTKFGKTILAIDKSNQVLSLLINPGLGKKLCFINSTGMKLTGCIKYDISIVRWLPGIVRAFCLMIDKLICIDLIWLKEQMATPLTKTEVIKLPNDKDIYQIDYWTTCCSNKDIGCLFPSRMANLFMSKIRSLITPSIANLQRTKQLIFDSYISEGSIDWFYKNWITKELELLNPLLQDKDTEKFDFYKYFRFPIFIKLQETYNNSITVPDCTKANTIHREQTTLKSDGQIRLMLINNIYSQYHEDCKETCIVSLLLMTGGFIEEGSYRVIHIQCEEDEELLHIEIILRIANKRFELNIDIENDTYQKSSKINFGNIIQRLKTELAQYFDDLLAMRTSEWVCYYLNVSKLVKTRLTLIIPPSGSIDEIKRICIKGRSSLQKHCHTILLAKCCKFSEAPRVLSTLLDCPISGELTRDNLKLFQYSDCHIDTNNLILYFELKFKSNLDLKQTCILATKCVSRYIKTDHATGVKQ